MSTPSIDLSSAQNQPLLPGSRKEADAFTYAFHALKNLSLGLAQEVERVLPGHRNGIWRHNHMQETADTVKQIQQEQGLDNHNALMLQIIFVCHDVGRFKEQLLKHNGLPTESHSKYSAELVEASGALKYLAYEDQKTILTAIRWHGEREVKLSDARALRFCYMLRDQDKLEIFQQDLTPGFILGEIAAWFFESSKVAEIRKESGVLEELVQKAWRGESAVVPESFAAQRVWKVANEALVPGNEAVKAVMESRSANAVACLQEGLPQFYLMHIAMSFDLLHPGSFAKVLATDAFAERWKYLEHHADPSLYQELRERVQSHLEAGALGKLPKQTELGVS